MTDYTLEDTIFQMFTTRAFATGIPTVLAGTPVVSAYENNNLTQITAGITLGVDHDGVVGMNLISIAVTAANGFEAGKDYNLVITTGTVGGVSVIGEVVGIFSVERSAAVADIAALNDVAATDIVSAGAITTLSGSVVTVDTTTVNTDMRGTDSALLAASAPTNFGDMAITMTSGRVDINANNDKAGYALSAAGVDAIWDEPLVGHITAGTTGKAVTDIETDVTVILVDTAEIGIAGAGLTDLGGMSTAMKAEVNAEADTALTDYDAPTNAEMIARTLLAADYFDPAADAVANVTLVATTTAVTNQVTADVTAISGDITAADNLELQYDGTGLAGDTFPATQVQIGSLSTGSAAISIQADSFTLTTGTVAAGSITDTETLNDVRHEINDAAGAIDMFYEFEVGSEGTGVEVNIDGRINSNNDDIDVFAFDFVGSTFDQIGTINGTNSSSDSNFIFNLLVRHTGTGIDIGKVRIKFLTPSGLTSATLRIDRIFTSFAIVSKSAGYSGGALWHNGSADNTNTLVFTDGTADNPVSSIAAMDTLAGLLNLKTYEFVAGDDITITQSESGKTFNGNNYQLKLNNQDPPTVVQGAEITGIANNTTTFFATESRLGTTTTPLTIKDGFVGELCGLVDIIIDATNADIEFLGCHGNTQGSMLDSFVDLKTGVTTNEVSFQRWGGPVTFKNMSSGDTVFMHGRGIITLDASCTGGTMFIAGNFSIVDNAGGVVNLVNHGEFAQDLISDKVWDEALSGHTAAGSFGKAIADTESDVTLILADTVDMQPKLGTPVTDISADIAALKDFDPVTQAVNVDRIGGSAPAATRLALSANQIIPFTVDTATFAPTVTLFEADDITEATADHFNDRIIIWTSGALSGQATSISDYELANGKGKFTVVGMTEAPANNDTGIII